MFGTKKGKRGGASAYPDRGNVHTSLSLQGIKTNSFGLKRGELISLYFRGKGKVGGKRKKKGLPQGPRTEGKDLRRNTSEKARGAQIWKGRGVYLRKGI